VLTEDLRYQLTVLGLMQRPQNLFLATRLFAIAVSSSCLPEDLARHISQLIVGLLFGFWVSRSKTYQRSCTVKGGSWGEGDSGVARYQQSHAIIHGTSILYTQCLPDRYVQRSLKTADPYGWSQRHVGGARKLPNRG